MASEAHMHARGPPMNVILLTCMSLQQKGWVNESCAHMFE